MQQKSALSDQEEEKESRNLEQNEEIFLESATIEQINKARQDHKIGQYGESLIVCRIKVHLSIKSDDEESNGKPLDGTGSGFLYKVVQNENKTKHLGIILTAAHLFYDPKFKFKKCEAYIRFNESQSNAYQVLKIMIPEDFISKDHRKSNRNDYGFLIVDLTDEPSELLTKVGWDFGPNFVPKIEFLKKFKVDHGKDQKLTMICPFVIDKVSLNTIHDGEEEFDGTFTLQEGADNSTYWDYISFVKYNIPTIPGHSGAVVGIVENNNKFTPVAVHLGEAPDKNQKEPSSLSNCGRFIDKEVISLGTHVEEEILLKFDELVSQRNRLVTITLVEIGSKNQGKKEVKVFEKVLNKGMQEFEPAY